VNDIMSALAALRIQRAEIAAMKARVDDAPANPGTYEGDHAKPTDPSGSNKWCARQCERSDLFDPGEPIKLPDFSKRLFNKPQSARCWCRTCRPPIMADMRMVLCPTCGNKRWLGRDGQATNGSCTPNNVRL